MQDENEQYLIDEETGERILTEGGYDGMPIHGYEGDTEPVLIGSVAAGVLSGALSLALLSTSERKVSPLKALLAFAAPVALSVSVGYAVRSLVIPEGDLPEPDLQMDEDFAEEAEDES